MKRCWRPEEFFTIGDDVRNELTDTINSSFFFTGDDLSVFIAGSEGGARAHNQLKYELHLTFREETLMWKQVTIVNGEEWSPDEFISQCLSYLSARAKLLENAIMDVRAAADKAVKAI